jgi:hypothetical protein
VSYNDNLPISKLQIVSECVINEKNRHAEKSTSLILFWIKSRFDTYNTLQHIQEYQTKITKTNALIRFNKISGANQLQHI